MEFFVSMYVWWIDDSATTNLLAIVIVTIRLYNIMRSSVGCYNLPAVCKHKTLNQYFWRILMQKQQWNTWSNSGFHNFCIASCQLLQKHTIWTSALDKLIQGKSSNTRLQVRAFYKPKTHDSKKYAIADYIIIDKGWWNWLWKVVCVPSQPLWIQ